MGSSFGSLTNSRSFDEKTTLAQVWNDQARKEANEWCSPVPEVKDSKWDQVKISVGDISGVTQI